MISIGSGLLVEREPIAAATPFCCCCCGCCCSCCCRGPVDEVTVLMGGSTVWIAGDDDETAAGAMWTEEPLAVEDTMGALTVMVGTEVACFCPGAVTVSNAVAAMPLPLARATWPLAVTSE